MPEQGQTDLSVTPFADVGVGREHWDRCSVVARHRHRDAYAAIVLAGGYEECGSRGRYRVGPGDVLTHAEFDAHLDRFAASKTEIFNLPLPRAMPIPLGAGRVTDPDSIVRVAERDVPEAVATLLAQFASAPPATSDWPDVLARDLARDGGLSLADWARTMGLAGETLSRGFRKVYGVTPARFRAEARAQRALEHLAMRGMTLASVAAAGGFADQPHMTRAVRALTGTSPGAWCRTSIPFKTGGV